jgi:hypothetical protein
MSIPHGLGGVRETLMVMRLLILATVDDDLFRITALELVANERPKNRIDELAALFEYVQHGVRYVRDPVGVEHVGTARQVLLSGQGDCDDKAVLLCALVQQIGFRTRLTAMGFARDQLSHVVVDVLLGDHWPQGPVLMLDATEERPMGWRPPGACRLLMIYNDP